MPEPNVLNSANYSQEARENVLNRVLRVFVSSTFNDMRQERDQLVQDVFPRIRRRCKERDVEFVPIDLRWGVTKEQVENGKTVDVCLSEIRRSRPFFIGLLGERYGWAPQKDEISKGDFSKWSGLENDVENRLSVTEIEIQFGVLREKTQIDAA